MTSYSSWLVKILLGCAKKKVGGLDKNYGTGYLPNNFTYRKPVLFIKSYESNQFEENVLTNRLIDNFHIYTAMVE